MMEAEVAESAPHGEAASASSTGKIFLGGLSWETNEDKLKDHFGKYGTILEVIVMRDRVTGKPRGFGFITFDTEEAAERACNDTHSLDGRTIDAKPSVPQDSQQRPRSKKIFVGGLAPETTQEHLKTYFERFGKVIEALIMVDHTSNRSRGFGFVTFEDESSVQKVFAAGSMHDLAGKRVEVKSATPKGSGPQGRGGGILPAGMAAGRGAMGAMGAVAAPGMVGQFAGPAGYGIGGYMAPGYMMPPGYGHGFLPYHPAAAFPGMVMGGFGYAHGFGPAGYPPQLYSQGPMRPQYAPQPQQQPQQQQQQQHQQPRGPGGASSSGAGVGAGSGGGSGARRGGGGDAGTGSSGTGAKGHPQQRLGEHGAALVQQLPATWPESPQQPPPRARQQQPQQQPKDSATSP